MSYNSVSRRKFIQVSSAIPATLGLLSSAPALAAAAQASPAKGDTALDSTPGKYPRSFTGEHLNKLAFPLGGIGTGTVCIEGTGCLSHVSLRHRPEIFNEPGAVFAALWIKQTGTAHVLEGPGPGWKKFGQKGPDYNGSANGGGGSTWGLPRFTEASFTSRFPFADIGLTHASLPVKAEITAWSPFVPGDANSSSLPVAALEYSFTNTSAAPIDCVYSFNAKNFMALGDGKTSFVRTLPNGFVLGQKPSPDRPHEEGHFAAIALSQNVRRDGCGVRGGWFDALTMTWNAVAAGVSQNREPQSEGAPSPGASLTVPFTLGPGETKTVPLLFAWYVPRTNLNNDAAPDGPWGRYYKPWYSENFGSIDAVLEHWSSRYEELKKQSRSFSDCFYDSTLDPAVIEAIAANLSILKSPTVLRQADGRLWAWEGCLDEAGSCAGSCTHVWNYAQAIPHLFPELERSLRRTEFGESQDERGHQRFRAALPIQPADHSFHAAADGQLGGIMKVYRDWRISGDTAWLRGLWPKVKASLAYCIATWDPEHRGWVEEPHHNTYDIEFWGPDGMCTSIYLGALKAATLMGAALGDAEPLHAELLARGTERIHAELFDGEYFFQKVEWRNLHTKLNTDAKFWNVDYSAEAKELIDKEGPKYQYSHGCLSDGILGAYLAQACGLGRILDTAKEASHLRSVFRYNFRKDLSEHANPQRPGFACGAEGGLLLCTWPKGGKPSLPFVYSDEVWTGIEYQVASHMMARGMVSEGLEIVRTCRARYDGSIRNPFDEYECGHWYARALASYSMLQSLSGARYDAVDRVLHLQPSVRGDFRCFLSTATGYGIIGVHDGKPFCEVRSGKIDVQSIDYIPAA